MTNLQQHINPYVSFREQEEAMYGLVVPKIKKHLRAEGIVTTTELVIDVEGGIFAQNIFPFPRKPPCSARKGLYLIKTPTFTQLSTTVSGAHTLFPPIPRVKHVERVQNGPYYCAAADLARTPPS